MIDIHCHIIPGVDDGVPTTEEAIALIQKEVNGGTEAFIATPHFIDRRDFDPKRNIGGHLDQLIQDVAQAGIRVEIYQGGEIYPTMAIFEALDKGSPITLAGKGKHILLDLPMGALPNDFDSILYEIQVRGITPILAHPERNGHFQEKPALLSDYIERGIACQVNAGSLSGKYGEKANQAIRMILRNHWAQFISSDAHRAGGSAILGTARSKLQTLVSEEYVELLTRESASAVIRGESLPPIPPAPAYAQPKRKGIFARVFGR